MEDLFQRMRTQDQTLIDKVYELLREDDDAVETEIPDESTEELQHLYVAENRMWEALEALEFSGIDRDAFLKAACAAHPNWGVAEFPKLEETDIPQIWEARFELIVTEIKIGSGWITELIDGNHAPVETEPETPAAEASENESNFKLDWLSFGYMPKKGIQTEIKVLSFRVICSNQLGDIPISKVPDTLKQDLLKLIKTMETQ